MKRVLVFGIILSMLLALFGCGGGEGAAEKSEPKVNEFKTSFDAESGTLTLSGKGKVVGLYNEEKGEKEPVEKEKILKVVIEEGITEIQSCFNNMTEMDHVQFPSSLESIYDSFKGESQFRQLYIPRVKIISDGSFSEAPLTSVELPWSVYLGNGAFDRLPKLITLFIPKGAICEGVFRDCLQLREVVVNENVQFKGPDPNSFQKGANFSRSNSNDFPKAYLRLPTDGENLPWGEGGAFKPIIMTGVIEYTWWRDYAYKSMYHRNMPLNEYTSDFDAATGTLTVTGIGDLEDLYPLSSERIDNLEIKKLVLSEGITGVYNCFNYLVALKEIELPSTLDIIAGSFVHADALESLVVPKTVRRIVDSSFNYCDRLKDLTFEGAITLGEPAAFFSCRIEKLIIPADSFLCGPFADCDDLKEIVVGPMTNITLAYFGDGDFIHSFDSTLPVKPKMYACSPIHPEWDYFDVRCGKDGAYKPIVVPEGENWEDYRNAPMERREDKKN